MTDCAALPLFDPSHSVSFSGSFLSAVFFFQSKSVVDTMAIMDPKKLVEGSAKHPQPGKVFQYGTAGVSSRSLVCSECLLSTI